MLIWRIATGILPTRLAMAQKLSSNDSNCPLCNESEESIEHLFFKCPISRAIWFGSTLALYSHHISISSCKDIIHLICEPHVNSNVLEHYAIKFASTLDCIWNLRNQVVHNDHKLILINQIKNLDARVLEHIYALESPDDDGGPTEVNKNLWSAPPPGTIKMNVDAAISNDTATIAVVARSHREIIVNVWTKPLEYSDPTVAEASAIWWALELVKAANFESVCIESDAKVCIDALSGPTIEFPWKIRALALQSLHLASCFSFCSFNWVRRNANQVAHAVAKVAPSLSPPFICNLNSLPTTVVEAWNKDLLSLV